MAKVHSLVRPISYGASSCEFGMKERKDCTVRALANAAQIEYPEAHQLLKVHGRKDMHGSFFETYHPAYLAAGMELEGVYGSTDTAKYIAKQTNRPTRKGLTVATALGIFNDGSYIFMVLGHAVAVVDGEVLDSGALSGAKSVVSVYRKFF